MKVTVLGMPSQDVSSDSVSPALLSRSSLASMFVHADPVIYANGRGFINLDLNDPDFDYPDTKAGLSVFHQVHCLVSEVIYSRLYLTLFCVD